MQSLERKGKKIERRKERKEETRGEKQAWKNEDAEGT